MSSILSLKYTINITSLFIAFPRSSFLPNRHTNLCFRSSFCFYRLFHFHCCLLPPLLFLSVFLRHSGMSPSTLLYLSRPPPPPFRLSFFLCGHHCYPFKVSCMLESPRQRFLSLSLPPSSLVLLLVCWCPCVAVSLTTHSLTFLSSFQADLSTAHSLCDEFFDCFSIWSFDFCFNVLVFDVC